MVIHDGKTGKACSYLPDRNDLDYNDAQLVVLILVRRLLIELRLAHRSLTALRSYFFDGGTLA